MITGVDEKNKRVKFRMEKSRFSLITKYRLRSIFGKPVRTILIIVGICFGSLIFLYTYGVVDSLKAFVNESVDQIGNMEYQYYFSKLRTDEQTHGTKIVCSIFESGKDGKATTLMGMKKNDHMNYKLVTGKKADIESGKYYITRMGSVVYDVSEIRERYQNEKEKTEIDCELKLEVEAWQVESETTNGIYLQMDYGVFNSGTILIPAHKVDKLENGNYHIFLKEKDYFYLMNPDHSEKNR